MDSGKEPRRLVLAEPPAVLEDAERWFRDDIDDSRDPDAIFWDSFLRSLGISASARFVDDIIDDWIGSGPAQSLPLPPSSGTSGELLVMPDSKLGVRGVAIEMVFTSRVLDSVFVSETVVKQDATAPLNDRARAGFAVSSLYGASVEGWIETRK